MSIPRDTCNVNFVASDEMENFRDYIYTPHMGSSKAKQICAAAPANFIADSN
jgi:hypothetical protein